MNRAGEFIKIFEKNISVRWWRTHLRPHATSFKKSRFYHIKHRFNDLSIVGNDVKRIGEYLEVWIVDVDNLFIFLNILWKYDELKKADPVLCCMGVFWLGWLWLEFISYWMNQRNVSLLTKMLESPFHPLNLYIYNYDETGIARFLESISNVTVTIYNLIYLCHWWTVLHISFSRDNYFTYIYIVIVSHIN